MFDRIRNVTPPVPTSSAPSATLTPAHPLPGRHLHILYADDMPELRELMTTMLGQDGHIIETVSNGDLALERLKQPRSDFDLLITDHHMPGITGLELVRQTRDLPYPGKIVVFSSELSELVHDEYRKCAVDAIMAKPIFPLNIRTVLEELFGAQPSASGQDHHPEVSLPQVHA